MATTGDTPVVRVRALGVVDCCTGLLLLAVPARVAALVTGSGARPTSNAIRLLGARVAAQGAAQMVHPTPTCAQLAAAADALHGASMFALAAMIPRYRRPALISAGIATGSAALGLAGTLGQRTSGTAFVHARMIETAGRLAH
jgi:hypothetical protein